jgi:hypothetical protein
MRDSDGDLIYWFRVEEDEDGEDRLCAGEKEPDDDEDTVAFTGITKKNFEFDDSYKIMCPECASEECEYIKGDIVDSIVGLDDDGWMEDGFDPFSSDDVTDEDPDDDDD